MHSSAHVDEDVGTGSRAYGDSGEALSWENALSYCENLTQTGHSDWRLPNAKELHTIVDYTRSPDTTNSPAIDALFATTFIFVELAYGANINGFQETNYPYFWSSTSHLDGVRPGSSAVYFTFGEAGGYMNIGGTHTLMDVHGAGAQRSDPKLGDPDNYPYGFGPQGDILFIYNFARCVRTLD